MKISSGSCVRAFIIAVFVVMASLFSETAGHAENPYSDSEYAKGKAALNAKEYEKAKGHILRAIQEETDDENMSLLYIYLGKAYHGMKQYDEAMGCFDKSISLAPKDSEPYCYRAIYKAIRNLHEEGYEDAMRGMAREGGKFQCYAALGHYYKIKGDREKSQFYFKKIENSL